MSTKSQNEQIMQHLRSGFSLTPLEAFDLCGTLALSSRISELRKRGHLIHSKLVKTRGGAHVSSYWLDESEQTEAPFILSGHHRQERETITENPRKLTQ